jgi:GT2 family glycosyltransferase
MKLLVVILNYRVTDLTIDCLRSLANQVSRLRARVAVVDNGSGGDAAERLRGAIDGNGWSTWAELIAFQSNRGFTGGNNAAIRAAVASPDSPEYVLLLNADTVVQEGALESLVEFMDHHPRAGIGGSRLLNPDGTIQGSPFRFLGIANEFDRALRIGSVSRLLRRWWVVPRAPEEPCAVDWVSGASMILRRTMLDEIGLLDEGFFTYFEDVDLCLRARRAGWQTWYAPESRVVHLESASSGLGWKSLKRRPAYWHQARRRFFLKNHGPVYAALVDLAAIVGYALGGLRRWIQRKPQAHPPHMLSDTIRHSVFHTGFQVTEVENPALRSSSQEDSARDSLSTGSSEPRSRRIG